MKKKNYVETAALDIEDQLGKGKSMESDDKKEPFSNNSEEFKDMVKNFPGMCHTMKKKLQFFPIIYASLIRETKDKNPEEYFRVKFAMEQLIEEIRDFPEEMEKFKDILK